MDQLRKGHAGPLNVIWDNAPAHHGEAVREYLRTPELELRLVNLPGYSPDFNGLGAGEGRQLPGRTGQPGKRGEAPLPDGPTVKGRSTPAKFPGRFPASECTSHLGLGLVPFPDGLVDTGKSLPTPDSRASGNDGQVKRVSGIRHIQVETVLNQGQGEMRRWWRASGPAGSFSKRGLDGFTGRTKPIFSPPNVHLTLALV